MNKQIFALYDIKAEIFGQPIFSPNLAVVTRDLEAEVNKNENPQNALAHHTSDFELYYIGTFDEEQGTILAADKPRLLMKLSSLKPTTEAAPIASIREAWAAHQERNSN